MGSRSIRCRTLLWASPVSRDSRRIAAPNSSHKTLHAWPLEALRRTTHERFGGTALPNHQWFSRSAPRREEREGHPGKLNVLAVAKRSSPVVSKNTNELKTGSPGRFVINVSTLGWRTGAVLALFAVGDVYVSLCKKKRAYVPFRAGDKISSRFQDGRMV